MSGEPDLIQRAVDAVSASRRYRNVDRDIVRRVVLEEHRKHQRLADLTKAAKKHLHRIYGAYLPKPPRYDRILDEIRDAEDRRERLGWAMSHHASTRERVPQLDAFYDGLRIRLGEVETILDLACGMNPLAAPWMPLKENGRLLAFDIDPELAAFLGEALATLGIAHQTGVVDLEGDIEVPSAEVAFLLKTAPCLDIPLAVLLPKIPAAAVVVSFPTLSLGRRAKGMGAHYARQLEVALAECGWTQRDVFEVPGELVSILDAPATHGA